MENPSHPHNHASHGLLVLGMHRSGTSVLTRLLHAAGAELGGRLVPGSKGNEEGHWEDAFAVETNERLLSALGYRWDDPRPLPPDWLASHAAAQAREAIRGYLRSTLSRHRLWALKDPRLCLLGELWLQAMAEEGIEPSVILMARHPREVADSLAARDGMAQAQGYLCWMRNVLAAERISRGLAREFLLYSDLVDDWQASLERLRRLPAGRVLATAEAIADKVAAIVQPARRHHVAGDNDDVLLPMQVASLWALQRDAAADRFDAAGFDTARHGLAEAEAVFGPVLDELAREQAELWRRTAHAEAALSVEAMRLVQVPAEIAQLRDLVQIGVERLNEAISQDIRRMQEAYDRSTQRAVELEARAGLADEVLPRLDAMHAVLIDHAHIQRKFEEAERALAELDALRRELVEARHQAEAYRADAEMLALIRRSWSWRLTRPLRLAMRIVRHRGLDPHDRRKLGERLAASRYLPRGLRRRILEWSGASVAVLAPAHFGDADDATTGASRADTVFLAEPKPGFPDVFVWAVIDWHFRTQRPQHLARSLAQAGHRVFYISNNLVDEAHPGFRVEPLDADGRLFQISLTAMGAMPIYLSMPDRTTIAQLRRSTGELMAWADSAGGICIVQHPFWSDVAGSVGNARLVYDCMDHHAGFENNAPDVLRAEQALAEKSDLLVVTSAWLDQEMAGSNPSRALIRNAAEHEHFCERPQKIWRDPAGRKVIGYYGAIAEWFDIDLVRRIAREFPDSLVLLVGNDTVGARDSLSDLSNVRFTGEVAYAELPYFLHGFDVALLPFKVMPLTLATNPVKVYEYLSAGKPVVSVDLPEIAQFGSLVARAADADAFVAAVAAALAEPQDEAVVQARRRFASEQTWSHRAQELDEALSALPTPKVSVIVVTYNNLAYTATCLRSLEEESDWPNLEVIVVDNASTDGTPGFLREWQAGGEGRRIILNDDNRGFSAANNQGLAAAGGDYLILLNNDTHVTRGWVRTLVNHLRRDASIGIVGPVTNNIGNEARIEIAYDDMAGMKDAAARYTRAHLGQTFDIRTLAFFCVAMPRSTYEAVGPLDEAFGIGFFEDDDYCRRVEQAGLRVVCAEDVFVHHQLSASFDKLKQERRQQLFEANRKIYEAKWGEWIPHRYRSH